MTAGVSTSNEDCLAPRGLTVPLCNTAIYTTTTVPQGYLMISGLKLVFFDGSAWKTVTSS